MDVTLVENKAVNDLLLAPRIRQSFILGLPKPHHKARCQSLALVRSRTYSARFVHGDHCDSLAASLTCRTLDSVKRKHVKPFAEDAGMIPKLAQLRCV